MPRRVKASRRTKSLFWRALILVSVVCGFAHAGTTHTLTRTFESTVGGQLVSLPAGTAVEAASDDGKIVEDRIVRVEKRHVVVKTGENEVADVALKALDKPSLDLVGTWKFQAGTKTPEPDPRVVPGKTFHLIFPEPGASRSSDPAKISIRIPDSHQRVDRKTTS